MVDRRFGPLFRALDTSVTTPDVGPTRSATVDLGTRSLDWRDSESKE